MRFFRSIVPGTSPAFRYRKSATDPGASKLKILNICSNSTVTVRYACLCFFLHRVPTGSGSGTDALLVLQFTPFSSYVCLQRLGTVSYHLHCIPEEWQTSVYSLCLCYYYWKGTGNKGAIMQGGGSHNANCSEETAYLV